MLQPVVTIILTQNEWPQDSANNSPEAPAFNLALNAAGLSYKLIVSRVAYKMIPESHLHRYYCSGFTGL